MKLRARKEALLPALSRVTGATERKSASQSLPPGLIGIQSSDGRLVFDGTDGEIAWQASTDEFSCDEHFRIAVQGKLLLDVLRQAPSEADVEFSVKQDKIEVVYGRSTFGLSIVAFEDRLMWSVADESEDIALDVAAEDLRRWLDATSFAMAVKDVRYFLEGILISVEGGSIHIVATDGHRLAHWVDTITLENNASVSAIIPRRAIAEIRRNLSGFSDNIQLRLGQRSGSVFLGTDRFDFRLIEGKYPDYERVIPKKQEKPVSVSASDLLKAIQRVSLVANDRNQSVRLKFDGSEIVVRSSSDHNEAFESVKAQIEQENLEIGFNPQYLIDVLTLAGDEDVLLSLRDSASSARVDIPSVPNARYVVMPIRL